MKVSALLQSLLIREVSECRKMVFFFESRYTRDREPNNGAKIDCV